MKRCSKCNRWLSKDSFSKDSNRKDGLDPYCKDCRKSYYKQNKERISEYHKIYYMNRKDKK